MQLRYPYLLAVSTVVLLGGTVVYLRLLGERLPQDNPLLGLVSAIVFVALLVVVARYFFLLWFSFLGHLETSTSEEATHFPLVSIIVPAFNEAKVIASAMRSLAGLDYPRIELVVVDDGSTDGTYRRALVEAAGLPGIAVRVVTQHNQGKARALNRGIAEARGELVLCVDGDSVLAPQSLRRAVRHFADPHVGAVAGNVKVVNRVNLLTWLQALEYVEGLNMVRRAQAFFGLVNIVPGPLGLFRREAIRSVGGYPADTYAEDCDLTLSLLERGWRLAYEPDAVSLTEAPEQLGPLFKQRYRWTRGMIQALRKRKHLVFAWRTDFATRLTLGYMLVECLLWPLANVLANVMLLGVVAEYGFMRLLVLWWLQLTLLDAVGALFCVAMEGEDVRLVPYALMYRMTFILLIDLCKVFSTLEEFFGASMSWGKLERLGRI